MTHRIVRRLLCAWLSLSLCGSTVLRAQEEPEAQDEATPSVLADEPTTPQETFDAVMLMLRIDRLDLAETYLQQFLAADPDEELLLKLQAEHGTATFLRLSRIEDLQPASQQLLEAIEQASLNKVSDPAYFDGLIDQLQGTPREQQSATDALRRMGADAVPGLLERLGQGERIAQHDVLLTTLIKIGPAAIDPLLAAIESPSERTRILAIEALGWIGDEAIVPHLFYPAFGSDQPALVQQTARRSIARIRYDDAHRTDKVSFNGVVDEVRELALEHFSGKHQWVTDDDGEVVVWSFDPQNGLVKSVVTPARASSFRAQRLAREAMLMAPERTGLQALFLATSLAEAGYRAGWDQPWPVGPGTAHNLALLSGADLTDRALQLALEHQNAAAALGALKALGATATKDNLVDGPGRKAAIVAALDYPHDRVQFAAASTVLQIDPAGPFAAAHRVVEILARALADDGGPASVVIDPNSQRGSNVAALLGAIGYEATVAGCGTDGFKTAVSRGDIELAVVHPNTVCWELTQTVANFKADARTANIPLAIYGPRPLRSEIRWLLDHNPHTKFIVTGGDSADWRRQLASLVNSVDVPPLTGPQRRQQIAIAAYWLRYIAEGARTDLFDLTPAETALSGAIENPDVADDALVALAAVPRNSAQQRLAETVTAPGLPEDLRLAAARALARHLRRFGRLLTDASTRELQQTWQNTDEPRLRTALTSVLAGLGTTPAGTAAALQDHPLAPSP